MDEQTIHFRISALVDQEHALRAGVGSGELAADDERIRLQRGSRKSSTSAGTCCANAPRGAVSVRIRAPRRPDRLRRSRATCSRSHHGCAWPVVRRTTTRAAAATDAERPYFRVPPTTLSAAAGSADLVQPADRRPVAGVPEALQLVVPRRTEQG